MSGILSESLGYDREKPQEDSVDTVSVEFDFEPVGQSVRSTPA